MIGLITYSNSLRKSVISNPDVGLYLRITAADKANQSAETGFFVWGSSIVKHENTYYYFGNKWDNTDGVDGWVHYNKVCISSSSNMLGPYSSLTEITELKSQSWAADMTTNPFIWKHTDNKYYLFYVGSFYSSITYPVNSSESRNNMRIGVAVADHPAGPWVPYSGNPILEPTISGWDQNIVNNPSVWIASDGKLKMVYKADYYGTIGDLRMGIVEADSPLGPWTGRTSEPNFSLDYSEDPNVWKENGVWYAVAKAFDNTIVPVGQGILYYSTDGITFQLSSHQPGYDLTINWTDETSNNCLNVERPFVYVENGVAKALFNACRITSNASFNLGRAIL